MSPVEAAIRVVCRDIGAGEWGGFLDLTLLGLAALLAALPPEMTVEQLAAELQETTP